jgi:hypothetical protein
MNDLYQARLQELDGLNQRMSELTARLGEVQAGMNNPNATRGKLDHLSVQAFTLKEVTHRLHEQRLELLDAIWPERNDR